MLTRCPTSSELEVFILDPEYPDRDRLNTHIESCPYCQISVAELKREWSELAAASQASASTTFIVVPIEEASTFVGMPAMAAKGADTTPPVRGLILASPDRVMWLKVVRDAQTEDIWLYLYSEDEALIPRNAVVRPFGMERDFVTDEQGRINLGRVAWPDKESLRAEVRLPSASFRLEGIGNLDRPTGEATLTSPAGDRLHVSWTADDRGRRITIEVQSLAGLSAETPLQIAVRARGVETPVQVRSSQLERPLTIEQAGSLDLIEIFVYK
jgi:hypothetical protein